MPEVNYPANLIHWQSSSLSVIVSTYPRVKRNPGHLVRGTIRPRGHGLRPYRQRDLSDLDQFTYASALEYCRREDA